MSQALAIPSLVRRLIGGKLVRKLFSSSVATAGAFVCKWLFNVVLSKTMSTGGFGVFSLLYSLANVLMNTFSFGGNLHLIYGISKDKNHKALLFMRSLWVTIIFSVLAGLVWAGFALVAAEHRMVLPAGIAVLIGLVMAVNILIFSYFKGQGNFLTEAVAQLFFLGIGSVVCAWMFWMSDGITLSQSLWIFFALNAIQLVFSVRKLREDLSRSGLHLSVAQARKGMREYWSEKLPYGLHEMQGALYTHVAILMLGFLVADEALGTYRSIQLLIVPVSILPSIFSQVALNQLTGKSDNPTAFVALFRKFLVLTSAMGIVILAVYLLVGATVIHWIYPNQFDPETVQVLLLCFSLTFCFKFISANYGVLITSGGRQRVRVWVTLGSIVVSVVLTLVLASAYGIVGAAIALAAANLLILLFYMAYGELAILKRMKACS